MAKHSALYKSVSVDVDIYLPDIIDDMDDDALVDALRERGYIVSKSPTVTDATEAFYAMELGRMDKVREFIADAAGRIA